MDNSQKFIVKNPPIVSESFGDEAVIVHLEKGTYYSVRGSAFTVWSLLTGGSSLGSIVETLCASYEGPRAAIEKGARELIENMQREGLVLNDGSASDNLADVALNTYGHATKPAFEDPQLEKYSDVEELLAIDPIHDVDAAGWPQPNPEKSRR